MSFRIHESRLSNNIEKIERGNELLEEAKRIVESQLLILASDKLQGKRIDAISSLVSILSIQHSKLISISKKDLENMKELLNDSQTYMSEGEIPKEWE